MKYGECNRHMGMMLSEDDIYAKLDTAHDLYQKMMKEMQDDLKQILQVDLLKINQALDSIIENLDNNIMTIEQYANNLDAIIDKIVKFRNANFVTNGSLNRTLSYLTKSLYAYYEELNERGKLFDIVQKRNNDILNVTSIGIENHIGALLYIHSLDDPYMIMNYRLSHLDKIIRGMKNMEEEINKRFGIKFNYSNFLDNIQQHTSGDHFHFIMMFALKQPDKT